MMLNMKRVAKYISVLFAVLLLTACGSNLDDYVAAEYVENCESEIANHYMIDTFAGHVTQNDDLFATPVVIQMLLNGEPTTLTGYTIYGQNYFRIDDIAFMLRDTLARFSFDTWALFYSSWGNHVSIHRSSHFERSERVDSEGEFYRTQVDISTSVPIGTGGTTPRDIIAPIEIFITESHPYFTLESLSSFLGFTIDCSTHGIISIDTREANISEYGHKVAEEFLSHRSSLFPRPYQNHDRDALSFMLYDISGNGIPDIFIQYAEQLDVYAVYIYFAKEGYLFIGTVNFWHEIMRDAEDRIYVVCGNIQDGFTDARMLIVHELQCEQWSSVLSPSAFMTNRNNTGLTFLTDMNKPATSIRPLQRNFEQEISDSVTMRLAIPAETTSVAVQILLNGELIFLTGHTIEGQNYFRLSDIAYILQDTRAHFDFTENRRNLHNADIHLNRWDGSFENITTTDSSAFYPIMVRLTADRTLGSTHGDVFWAGDIVSFGTEHDVYLTLEDLSGVLGFFLGHATDNTIIIDTSEVYISEYGRSVAKEFLMQRPTVFHPYPWSDEILAITKPRRMSDIMGSDEWHGYDAYVLPHGFILHDLRGNGIPDIFLSYWFWDLPTVLVIYSYLDGGYERIGTVGIYGEIFHDRQGRIFFLEGTHQMGYDTMRTLTFNDHGAKWDILKLIDWYSDSLIENLCERGSLFWDNWTHPTPVMPDNLNEPLTANRFLRDLTRYVRESLENIE